MKHRFIRWLTVSLIATMPVLGILPPQLDAQSHASSEAAHGVQAAAATQTSFDIRRAGGSNRFETAATIARLGFPSGADTVFLATGADFPDALAVGSVAGLLGGPILLVGQHTWPEATEQVLQAFTPRTVVILGGINAVGEDIAAAAEAITGVVPRRIAGPDRFATAAAISADQFSPGADVVYVATGTNFPDAVAGGPLASSKEAPMLLVQPDAVPAATRAELLRLAPKSIVVLGGPAAVADSVVGDLRAFTAGSVTRLSGPDRYATAVEISKAGFTKAETVYLATGANFPDALTGGPAAFASGGPVLLTRPDCVPQIVVDEMQRLAAAEVVVLGGSAAVSREAATIKPCGAAGSLPPFSVSVDAGIRPAVAALPGGRDVVSLVDPSGDQLDFVANEMLLFADADLLGLALHVTGGSVVETITGFGSPLHLIRLPDRAGDPDSLEAILLELEPRAMGEMSVSSSLAVGLLETIGSLASDGVAVGLNPLLEGHDLIDRQIAEAPTAAFSDPYSPNPFDWGYLNSDDPPTLLGVTEAWRALALAGQIPSDANRIRIAMLDSGFAPDAELPPGTTGANGKIGPLPCSDGSPCPWHGTNTAVTAAGVVNNGRGAAGTGGPVATLELVHVDGDWWSMLKGFVNTLDSPIINMSIGTKVGALASVLTLPADLFTDVLSKNRIFVASAGNKGENVDDEDCVWWVCWESARYLPCEFSGVLCVGGMQHGTTTHAAGSNYGSEDVDIWAPYSVLVGPDPDHPKNEVRMISGTSFSSPYTAGVLALIWAANPSLSRDQVLSIMKKNSHAGSGRVTRYVYAYGAVTVALGDNLPPEFAVTHPAEGLVTGRGQWLPLVAQTSDDDGPDPVVEWRLDGSVIATGNSTSYWLTRDNSSLGAHTVDAKIVDGIYDPVITRNITVQNTEPTVEIQAPAPMTTVCLSCLLVLRARDPLDPDEPSGELASSQLLWRTGGATIAQGKDTTTYGASFGAPGTYWLELRGTDSNGAVVTDSVQVQVTADPIDLPPVAVIAAPDDGDSDLIDSSDTSGWYTLVTLDGEAYDPEALNPPYVGSVLTYQWTVTQIDGDPQPTPVFVGSATDLDTSVKLYNNGPTEHASYRITLTVTEADGPSADDTVTFHVNTLS